MILIPLAILSLAAGYTARHFRMLSWLTGWLLSGIAWWFGATWFIERRGCGTCGRKVHLMRAAPLGSGHLCAFRCAGRSR